MSLASYLASWQCQCRFEADGSGNLIFGVPISIYLPPFQLSFLSRSGIGTVLGRSRNPVWLVHFQAFFAQRVNRNLYKLDYCSSSSSSVFLNVSRVRRHCLHKCNNLTCLLIMVFSVFCTMVSFPICMLVPVEWMLKRFYQKQGQTSRPI